VLGGALADRLCCVPERDVHRGRRGQGAAVADVGAGAY
jgi:hypothetical protein